MGNILPLPCVRHCCCHDRSRNVWAARARHVVVPVVDDKSEGGGGREQEAPWPECRVEAAGRGDDGAVRVRIVMKRKDVARLVARLEAQRGAEERNAAAGTMEEVVSTELAGCNSDGVTMMMNPCWDDAWRPRLSIIPENS